MVDCFVFIVDCYYCGVVVGGNVNIVSVYKFKKLMVVYVDCYYGIGFFDYWCN